MTARTKNILFGIGSGLVLACVFVGGIYVGYSHRSYAERVADVSGSQAPSDVNADFAPFWKVWETIDEKYPDAKSVSSQDRVYGAIKGLVASLGDPYSVYFPPQDSKNFADNINGSFEGIGMEVGMKDNLLTVVAPIKGSPSDLAGIKSGDVISKINGAATATMSVDQAVDLIRGTKGTSVVLTVVRDGAAPMDITVVRDTINIPMIDNKDLGNGVYQISLYEFGTNSSADFANAVTAFKASGDTKLIIDLRGNPGGYLDAAVDIASMILPQGDLIVTESYGNNKPDDVYRSKGYGTIDPKKTKITILVDGGSASAAEILSGALQENGDATLIGEKTYGKGSVQELINVTSDTTLKLTIAKWLTPNGTWISKKGIEPDIVVPLPTTPTVGVDPILNRALDFLNTGK